MSFNAAVYTRMAGFAGVSDIVGTQIYPQVAPSSTVGDYLVFSVVSSIHEHHMGSAAGVSEKRLQVVAYASTPDDAETLAEAIRSCWSGYRGTVASIEFISVSLDSQTAGLDDLNDGSEVRRFNVLLEFLIWHRESIPTF